MDGLHIYNLIIDDEFQRIMPTLSTEEYTDIKHEVTYSGYRVPIKVWQKILIDDKAYYDFYHQYNIPFYIEEMNFKSRNEAITFICNKTLERKNLIDEHFRYCIGKFYIAVKNIMIELYPIQNQYTPPEKRRPGDFSSRHRTAAMLADKYPMSPGTIYKYGTYAAAVDQIAAKAPEVAAKILTGDFHLSHDNTLVLVHMAPDAIRVIYDHVVNHNDTSLLFSEIKRNRQRKQHTIQEEIPKKKSRHPEIKQMPKYDPDAEISSLTLTIPTWISSMRRTHSIANFDQASMSALWKLEQQLLSLNDTVYILQKVIEEKYHE